MRIQHKCLDETLQPPYFQNRIIMFSLPIPTHIYLWKIYIFSGSVCLFCCLQICGPILGIYINHSQTHECGNWDWGCAISRKGIHKWNFYCSAVELPYTCTKMCIMQSVKVFSPRCSASYEYQAFLHCHTLHGFSPLSYDFFTLSMSQDKVFSLYFEVTLY